MRVRLGSSFCFPLMALVMSGSLVHGHGVRDAHWLIEAHKREHAWHGNQIAPTHKSES